MGFEGGVHLLVDMLSAMQDLTYTIQLPVARSESIRLYRDHSKGNVCSSVHPSPLYDEDDVEQVLSNACQMPLPPEAVVLVDTGSTALTEQNMRIIKPYVEAWGAPIFLLSLGEASRISTAFEYAAVVRQAYCRHDQLCTCLCNRLYIHDLEIGGFCNTNTFKATTQENSKAPFLGLGEMAMAYIVSEYARDASLRKNLGRSLAFLKYAFTSIPADTLVLNFGRGMVKEFEESRRKCE